jgi:ribosome modulation factor
MQDPDEQNPYSEDEPKLRRAWEDGYRAAKRGKSATSILDHRAAIREVWQDGYKATLDENGEA